MKVLVTGGAGYKGVLLTKILLDKGHEVAILDNFMYGYAPVMHLVPHENFSIVTKDVRLVVEADLTPYDAVIHLAGISGLPACKANAYSAKTINVEASRNLTNLLSKDQILLYASTTSFYGRGGNDCFEDTPVDPVSLYGVTKYEAEVIVQERENSTSFRFATVFGCSPKMRSDLMVNDFVYQALTNRNVVLFDSQSKRTFIHVLDAVRVYAHALDNWNTMKGEVYNVGNNNMNYSKYEIAEAVKKHIPHFEIIDSTQADVDVRNFNVRFDKIQNIGYELEWTIDRSIRNLIKLYSFYKMHSHFNVI